MMRPRSIKIVGAVFAAITVAGLLTTHAKAQDWPAKPIKIIVGFAPGSINDTLPRLMAPMLTDRLGQQVIVENRTGAGGMMGTEAVARAAPDGYTLMLGTSSQLVMNIALHKNISFSIENDLVPVALLLRSPLMLVGNASLPARDLKELLAFAKANPGRIKAGSGGNGSISHAVLVHLERVAGISLTHIPYRGNGPALTALVAGEIDILFDGPLSSGQHVKSGALRAYANSNARSPAMPEVPTFEEAGLPGYESYTWNSIMVPAATPRPIVERLNTEIRAVMNDPALRQRMEGLGSQVISDATTEQVAAFIKRERDLWVPVMRATGVTADQ